MLPPLFLFAQAAVAISPAPLSTPLGAWLAIIAGALAILGGAYRLGAVHADVRNLKTNVDGSLRNVAEKLDDIARHIEESRAHVLDAATWRERTDGRLQHLENADIDRRSGPPDRRHLG